MMEPAREEGGKRSWIVLAAGALAVIAAGTTTGYLLAGSSPTESSTTTAMRTAPKERPKSAEEDKAFSECAEGKLEVIKQSDSALYDGTHRLVTGDPSKDAYLTSSVVDLTKYEGDSVTVWGESHASRKVKWLMDVGRIIPETGKCQR